MCAMMPIFRVLANGDCLGISTSQLGVGDWGLGIGLSNGRQAARSQSPIPNPQSPYVSLPAIVSKRLVRFGHAVRVFAFLDRAAAEVGCVEQLVGQLLLHRLAVA